MRLKEMKRQEITLAEAARYLGVSERKVWKLSKEGTVTYRQDPLDKRKKLFKLADLKKLKEASII
jgi:excisionase family DNA binding protein